MSTPIIHKLLHTFTLKKIKKKREYNHSQVTTCSPTLRAVGQPKVSDRVLHGCPNNSKAARHSCPFDLLLQTPKKEKRETSGIFCKCRIVIAYWYVHDFLSDSGTLSFFGSKFTEHSILL